MAPHFVVGSNGFRQTIHGGRLYFVVRRNLGTHQYGTGASESVRPWSFVRAVRRQAHRRGGLPCLPDLRPQRRPLAFWDEPTVADACQSPTRARFVCFFSAGGGNLFGARFGEDVSVRERFSLPEFMDLMNLLETRVAKNKFRLVLASPLRK